MRFESRVSSSQGNVLSREGPLTRPFSYLLFTRILRFENPDSGALDEQSQIAQEPHCLCHDSLNDSGQSHSLRLSLVFPSVKGYVWILSGTSSKLYLVRQLQLCDGWSLMCEVDGDSEPGFGLGGRQFCAGSARPAVGTDREKVVSKLRKFFQRRRVTLVFYVPLYSLWIVIRQSPSREVPSASAEY